MPTKKRTLKPCRQDQYRNPETNRCVKIKTKKMMRSSKMVKTHKHQNTAKMSNEERNKLLKFSKELVDEAATPYNYEGKIINKTELSVLTARYLYDGEMRTGTDICKLWLINVLTKDNVDDALQAYNDMKAGAYDYGEYGENTNKYRKLLKQKNAEFKKLPVKKDVTNKPLEKLFKHFALIFLNDTPSFGENYNKQKYYTIIACALLIDGYKSMANGTLDSYKYNIYNEIKLGLHNIINNNGNNDYHTAFCKYILRSSVEKNRTSSEEE